MWQFIQNNLSNHDVIELLTQHQNQMAKNSPAESRHVLSIDALKQADITFWSLWNNQQLMGCVALKSWHEDFGEIKSMKTSENVYRQGVGKRLLAHIVAEAQRRNYKQLKLETGSMAFFEPARKFYLNHGFKYCEPFGHYINDPNNVFMALNLEKFTSR